MVTTIRPQIPTIKIVNVYKVFRRGKLDVPALYGLSCEFYAGEISVIMGPSGSGKSTLLNLVSGLISPDSGQIRVRIPTVKMDLSLVKKKVRDQFRRDHIAYIYQTNNLIPYLTCYENAVYPSLMSRHTRKNSDNDPDDSFIRPEAILKRFGLSARSKHLPHELSGGEQQRTCIAAALLKHSEIILCDEPTGELDTLSKFQFFKILDEIIREHPTKSIIIVTHDPSFKAIAHRVYYLRDGEVVRKHKFKDLAPYRAKFQSWIARGGKIPEELMDIILNFEEDPAIAELEEVKRLIVNRLNER